MAVLILGMPKHQHCRVLSKLAIGKLNTQNCRTDMARNFVLQLQQFQEVSAGSSVLTSAALFYIRGNSSHFVRTRHRGKTLSKCSQSLILLMQGHV